MKRTPVLALVAALAMAGCANDPEEAVEEADPGLEVVETTDGLAGASAEATEAGGIVPEGTTEECFQAVAAAGNETPVEGFEDDATPLWPAFDACASIEEFSAATESVSGILGDEDPQTYVSNLCNRIDEIAGSTLCLEVSGG